MFACTFDICIKLLLTYLLTHGRHHAAQPQNYLPLSTTYAATLQATHCMNRESPERGSSHSLESQHPLDRHPLIGSITRLLSYF